MSNFGSGGLGAPASSSTSGSLTGNASQGTSPFKTTTPALKQPAPLITSVFGSGGSGAPASSSTSGSLTGNASQGTSLFKTTTPALKQPAPLTTSSFAFGAGPATTGTTIKFKVLTGTDTMMKRVSITINTSHQCITCMKEYENKSLEELRLEDYTANRKGGQAGMVGFGATTQQSSIFSAPVSQQSGFNFGANQNKSLFGTSNTGTFTSTGGSIFSQNTQTQNVLGKTAGFGLPAQRTSSAFGTGTGFDTGTSVFGQPQQKSLLGQPAATGLFGQTAATTQASTGFGTGFGSTFEATTQASAFGVKQPFGVATTSAPSVFSFGSTANTGKQPAFTFQFTASTPFDTGTTGFGGFSTTPATGTGLFGAPKTTLSCGTGTTPAFGTTGFGTTGFGTTPPRTASTGTGLFGVNTAAKTTGFGFDTSTTGTSLAFGVGPSTTGTTVKFKALTGTDYMMKNGVSSIINTSHQFITCMKEYENKSLEELRLEDYAANRKGGQAGMVGFGATTQQSSIFSVPVFQQSTFNFGADQSKLLIGTSDTGTFTSTGGSIFGQNTQTKATSFGLPAQPISTAIGTGTAFGTSTSVYGQSQQKANAFGGYSSLGMTEMYRRKVVCAKCYAEIQGTEQPIHCSGTCQGTYHRRCVNVGPTEYEIRTQGFSGAFKCPTCTCRSAEDSGPLPPRSSGDYTNSSGAIAGENESDRASTSGTSRDLNAQTLIECLEELQVTVENLANELRCRLNRE